MKKCYRANFIESLSIPPHSLPLADVHLNCLAQGDDPSLNNPSIINRGNPPKSKMMQVKDRTTGLSLHFYSIRAQSTALFQDSSRAFMVTKAATEYSIYDITPLLH